MEVTFSKETTDILKHVELTLAASDALRKEHDIVLKQGKEDEAALDDLIRSDWN
jgi:hypothetical protein